MPSAVHDWSVNDVAAFLGGLELDSLVPEFKKNAVNGKDLLELEENEMVDDLKCTHFQIKKIRRALDELAPGAGATKDAKSSAAASNGNALAPPAVAPKAAPKPDLKPEDLLLYQSFRSEIAELEGQQVESAAVAARHRLDEASSQYASALKSLNEAESNLKEAAKNLEKLDHWRPDHLLPGKFGERHRDAKHQHREEVLKETTVAAEAARKKAEDDKMHMKSAQGESDALRAKVEQLNAARSKHAALIETIFAAPAWVNDITLSTLRAAIQDLSRQAAEASSHSGTYTRARDLLRSAQTKILQALEQLRQTRFLSYMEMGMDFGDPFRRDRGDLMVDMFEMMAIEKANELIKSAAGDFMAAKQILPALPFQHEAAVNSARMGVFVSMLAPGIMGDMAEQMMIKHSMVTVKEMQAGVEECRQWAQKNLDTFSLNASQLRAAEQAKRAEIRGYECSVLNVAAGKA